MYIIKILNLLFDFKLYGSLQCVGTDRNIQDSILQNRANTLYNILVTFHYNIIEISDQSILKDTFNTVISSYLSLLLVSSNIFGTTSVLKFPKVRFSFFIYFLVSSYP